MRPLFAVAAVLALIALAACEVPAPKQVRPDIRFSHLDPIFLDVEKIEIAGRYRPPLAEPNIEHLVTPTPMAALKNWANDRLRATGVTGSARFIILDASLVKTPLPQPKGIKGFFTTAQEARYTLKVHARLEFDRRDAERATGYADAEVTRERTIPENVSVNKRNDILFELVAAAANEFDAEMERQIREHLKRFVR